MVDSPTAFGPSASWENLKRRAALLSTLRDFFARHEFVEVETPLLSHDTVVDRHLDPISVQLLDDPREPDRGTSMWLQTSPEFAMKRLIAAGARAIYQVTRAFRNGERGPLHNPEFTMVEWYRAGDTMQQGIDLLDQLGQTMLQRGPAERIRYAEAFERVLGIDPLCCPIDKLQQTARRHGFVSPESWDSADRDAWLDWLLVTHVEPTLGKERPSIVYDYPASQAALARVRQTDMPVAERFELYADGVELANGYHELLDPVVLVRRIRQANTARIADGKMSLPEDSRLLSAMRHGLPPCTGVALGFDRLVMVALGATTLSQVMAFPVDRA